MSISLCLCLLFIASAASLEVFNWRRQLRDKAAVEFAEVRPEDKTITHSGVDSNLLPFHTPSITFHDFSTSKRGFKKSMVAIRPLIEGGKRICFIISAAMTWNNAVAALAERSWGEVGKDSFSRFYVRREFPNDLDPSSVSSVHDFCGVSRESVFHLQKTDDVSTFPTKIRIQSLFRRLLVGIPDDLHADVFGS